MAGKTDTWRTVRFFLDDDGVYEVLFDHTGTTRALRCDCEAFLSKGGCPHVAWAMKNDFTSDGRIRYKPGMASLDDPRNWRAEVLSNLKVEVVT
jgi:hypothetical protein